MLRPRPENYNVIGAAETGAQKQMSLNDTFSCVLVGIGSHLIQCAEILLQRGHRICGIISTEPRIVNWAREHHIPCIEDRSDLVASLRQQPFDYLFSIVWPFIIPDEVLALPRKGAINFHDGPLPRYAGLNATAWALIHLEKKHGVTWHIMSDKVDAGDILKQRFIAVREDDTSFSLNVRCYEAGIESFAELVDELSGGQVKPRRQDLAERSYFGKHKRPPAACILRWNQPARQIAALVRALDFGPYTNPLGMAKFVLGEEVFLVPEVDIVPGDSSLAPGTVATIEQDRILVCTADDRIALGRLLTLEGQPVRVAEIVYRFGIRNGDRLPDLDADAVERLDALNKTVSRHEMFWVHRLADPRPLELPFASHLPAAGGALSYAVTRTLVPTEAVAWLAAQCGCTSGSAPVIAAFAAYLARISDNYRFDLNFGHPSLSSRITRAPSLFAARVPLRVELNPRAGFGVALHILHEELEQIDRNVTYARDVIARYPKLHPLRTNGGRSPAQITIQRIAASEDPVSAACGLLTLCVPDDGEGLLWVYGEAVLDAELVAGMQRQFLTFLENATADCSLPLNSVCVLGERERRRLLIQWNDTRVDYPRDRCIHHWFETQGEQTPEAVAVAFGEQQFTYRQLNQRANQLAHWLNSQGVGPDVPVGVALERSLEMVAGLYGVLKAGGAYVPLDPAYPTERLAYMAQEAGVRIVLTQARLLERLPKFDGQVVCLDADWDKTMTYQSLENPQSNVDLENLAYIIYTSGSTGKPKGVMNTHGGILNRLLWMQDEYHLTTSDRVLQKTPFSFDVSVWEFFWPLMFGGRLVVARPEGHKDCEYLVKTIIDQRITIMHFVPSMLRLFLEARAVEKCDSLRHVICSGEALSVDLPDRFFRRLDARLHNLYGPTEAAVDVTSWECRRDGNLTTVPIGRPVANTQLYILDSHLRPTPVGVPGELHIGGVQVARGYVNRPDLTAERFIPDPFSADPTARLYKTGDLVRYLPDGNIEYLGRLDQQIKVRGLRIELGEIESVLTQHPAIREAAVVGREDTPGDQRLVAYVVPRPAFSLDPSELRDHLRQSLPDYMVPAFFVELDALPVTSSGKVDRRSLPAPKAQPWPEAAHPAPRNGLEKAIAQIWKEVLRVERVGIHDNFFDLGGHSLLIVQVHRRLSEITDRTLSVADLFKFSTISALAEHLSRNPRVQNVQAQIAVQRSARRAMVRKAAMMRRQQVT